MRNKELTRSAALRYPAANGAIEQRFTACADGTGAEIAPPSWGDTTATIAGQPAAHVAGKGSAGDALRAHAVQQSAADWLSLQVAKGRRCAINASLPATAASATE